MDEPLQKNDRVTWWRTDAGGYRYRRPVPAIVVGVHRTRVLIEVAVRPRFPAGCGWRRERRTVKHASLTRRELSCAQLGE